jgi:hypothetical protein
MGGMGGMGGMGLACQAPFFAIRESPSVIR